LLGFPIRQFDYDPFNHVSDGEIRKHLAQMDTPRRHALAEQITCNIDKHEFFLARQANRSARLSDETMALRSFGTLLENAPKLATSMVPGKTLRYADGTTTLQIPCTPVSKLIYAHMDGQTSLRKLRLHIQTALKGIPPAQIEQELQQVYEQLHPRGYLYLIEAGQYGVTVPDYARLDQQR
jgi:hypothetical protein